LYKTRYDPPPSRLEKTIVKAIVGVLVIWVAVAVCTSARQQLPTAHTMYGVAQNLTSDNARLERAIDSTALASNKRADGEEWGNCNCGTCRVEAITRVATAVRGEPQRRKRGCR